MPPEVDAPETHPTEQSDDPACAFAEKEGPTREEYASWLGQFRGAVRDETTRRECGESQRVSASDGKLEKSAIGQPPVVELPRGGVLEE